MGHEKRGQSTRRSQAVGCCIALFFDRCASACAYMPIDNTVGQQLQMILVTCIVFVHDQHASNRFANSAGPSQFDARVLPELICVKHCLATERNSLQGLEAMVCSLAWFSLRLVVDA